MASSSNTIDAFIPLGFQAELSIHSTCSNEAMAAWLGKPIHFLATFFPFFFFFYFIPPQTYSYSYLIIIIH